MVNTSSNLNVDIAGFGSIKYWTGSDPVSFEGHNVPIENAAWSPVDVPEQEGRHWGVEWESPRQFCKVVVTYRSESEMPNPEDVRLQYWHVSWPAPFKSGWTPIDDPYNGRWVTAKGDVAVEGTTWTYTFDPLDITELPKAEDFPVFYRQSYRIRFLYKTDSDVIINAVQVFSDSTWRETILEANFEGMYQYSGGVDVHNGRLLSLDDSDPKHLKMRVQYADCEHQTRYEDIAEPPDRTIVTINASPRPFSILVSDALKGPIAIKDFGVTVGVPGNAGFNKSTLKPIYDRILSEPEQSYERASAEIPQLIKTRHGSLGRYVCIGCEANRQEFAYRYNGDLFADKNLLKVMGRDTAKLLWPGVSIFYRFPTGDPPDFRMREDGTQQSALNGYLPIFTSCWKDREIVFEKTVFACLIEDDPWDLESKRGDEPVAAMMRVCIRNTTEEQREAVFRMVIEPAERLELYNGFVYATGKIYDSRVPDSPVQTQWLVRPYDQRRLRAYFNTCGKGNLNAAPCTYEPNLISSHPISAEYRVLLQPHESHSIDIAVPFITYLGAEGENLVRALDYDSKLREMVSYWESRIAAGACIETPELIINDYLKATVPHIAITADRDIESGLYMLPAGTYAYPVCANEACHQIRALDFQGYHSDARKYLEPFVKLQGSRPLHGKFKTQEGVLHGLRVNEEIDYQTFNYNLDHGFVLFQLAEHFKLTGDVDWAKSIEDNLIAACDFVTRERQSTMDNPESGIYGLLPPGHLEDNPEWLYWFAVNGYSYRGMKAAAEVLTEIGSESAERIAAEAEAYRKDIYRAMELSMINAPVVRLIDGSYQPFVPTRAQLRGRDLGWIRDSLYGPVHTAECGVMDVWDPMVTWMLRDLEDNVFISRYRGRRVDIEKYWFSQGGNTIQSGLLPIALIYIKRDQPEHAVRAIYNSLAQNLYPDVRCFTEHPVEAFGLGIGPSFKTPDENCWVVWLRHALLTEIDNRVLRLCPAVPRAWFKPGKTFSCEGMATYYGKVSFRVESTDNKITAEILAPERGILDVVELRLRHPEKMLFKQVKANGMPLTAENPESETIRLRKPEGRIVVETEY